MTGPLLVIRRGALSAVEAARHGLAALDRPLEGDAELSVIEVTTPATVLGAFQRHHGVPMDLPLTRRVSGGPAVRVGVGTLHVVLALEHPAALVPGDARRIVNRSVRPLLRALTRGGALAHYFGRDCVSVSHQPVAEVGFAHDSRSGRSVFEAFVAVRYPFALGPRPSFQGRAPGTLESVTGRAFDLAALATSIAEAYAVASGRALSPRALEAQGVSDDERWEDPPWVASVEEAIGVVAAGPDARGVLRLGGDLMASRDALDRLATAVDALPADAALAAIGGLVDQELGAPQVALDGVRDLASVRDVLALAKAARL